ncbi:MAG TPA: HAD family hydrolase [Terriglobales bacterium]|nr:HAD family hydrolase [Terriglobales bacterium]
MQEFACEGVLFDLDGVLVDSTPAVARVWTIWARTHGFDPEDTVRRAHGRPSLSSIKELLPGGNHEEENRIVEQMEIKDLEGVVPLPGAMELLGTLPRELWAIVTSCTKRLAHARIHAAGLPAPKFLVTANDIKIGKPDPEPYLKGAALLGLSATVCVVVEDAPAGIRAGKAAGARVLALQTTERDELLRGAGADWIVKDCSAVTLDGSGKAGSMVLKVNFL